MLHVLVPIFCKKRKKKKKRGKKKEEVSAGMRTCCVSLVQYCGIPASIYILFLTWEAQSPKGPGLPPLAAACPQLRAPRYQNTDCSTMLIWKSAVDVLFRGQMDTTTDVIVLSVLMEARQYVFPISKPWLLHRCV